MTGLLCHENLIVTLWESSDLESPPLSMKASLQGIQGKFPGTGPERPPATFHSLVSFSLGNSADAAGCRRARLALSAQGSGCKVPAQHVVLGPPWVCCFSVV